ncbi:hypothetical protein GUITHDRAFT_149894, partial [Guillardia theta CCMP2712]
MKAFLNKTIRENKTAAIVNLGKGVYGLKEWESLPGSSAHTADTDRAQISSGISNFNPTEPVSVACQSAAIADSRQAPQTPVLSTKASPVLHCGMAQSSLTMPEDNVSKSRIASLL